MWVRNPNQKSSASQWLNGSHHPPLAQTPFAALRSSREAGELSWVDFKRDDSQSEVFYYAIFISSKTGLVSVVNENVLVCCLNMQKFY